MNSKARAEPSIDARFSLPLCGSLPRRARELDQQPSGPRWHDEAGARRKPSGPEIACDLQRIAIGPKLLWEDVVDMSSDTSDARVSPGERALLPKLTEIPRAPS